LEARLNPDADWAAIDWGQPWLAPWRTLGEAVLHDVREGLPLPHALQRASHLPLTFVPQASLPAGTAYEDFIFRTQQCPVREGLHDFFNGLCWMQFPLSKQRLNHLQAIQIAADGVQSQRGPVRDAITVLDENGALLDAPPALWEALLARDWQRLFVTLRPLWAQSHLLLFGHALLEKLVVPRKPIVAHIYRPGVAVQRAATGAVNTVATDQLLCQSLSAEALSDKPFVPMPVLGVPGWWPANEDPCFYDDVQVFRPARTSHRQPHFL